MNERARAMLTELADLLEALPPERFDYGVWVGRDWKGAADLSCGTTACAAGWATTLPSFQATGLKLEADGVVVIGDWEFDGVEAMAESLGISVADADFLFVPDGRRYDRMSPSENANAAEVAAHIRQFLAEEAS